MVGVGLAVGIDVEVGTGVRVGVGTGGCTVVEATEREEASIVSGTSEIVLAGSSFGASDELLVRFGASSKVCAGLTPSIEPELLPSGIGGVGDVILFSRPVVRFSDLYGGLSSDLSNSCWIYPTSVSEVDLTSSANWGSK